MTLFAGNSQQSPMSCPECIYWTSKTDNKSCLNDQILLLPPFRFYKILFWMTSLKQNEIKKILHMDT